MQSNSLNPALRVETSRADARGTEAIVSLRAALHQAARHVGEYETQYLNASDPDAKANILAAVIAIAYHQLPANLRIDLVTEAIADLRVAASKAAVA
mgnify:CR=1 FL=1